MYTSKCLFSVSVAILLVFLAAAATFALDKDIMLYLPFDEGNGDQVSDQSGHGNNGVIKGNPGWVEGKLGNALEFNGTSDFVEVANSATLNITDAVTVLAWIQLSKDWYPAQYGNIAGINRVGGQTADAYYLNVGYYSREHDKVSMGIIGEGVAETPLQGKTPVLQGEWVFVAGVFSGGKFMRVYLNGELDNELTSVPDKIQATTDTPFTVGAIAGSTDYSFQGTIDEVVVYSRALTTEEIKSIMARGIASVQFAGKLTVAWGEVKGDF